jgi:hypothetical protein
LTSCKKKAEEQGKLIGKTSREYDRNARSFQRGGAMLEKPPPPLPKETGKEEKYGSSYIDSCANFTMINFRTFASLLQSSPTPLNPLSPAHTYILSVV